MLRTGRNTYCAAGTFFIIDMRNTVRFNMDGVKRTGHFTVAEADTTPIAFPQSVDRNLCGAACFNADIIGFFFADIVRTLAKQNCDFCIGICRNAHNRTDFRRNGTGADGTAVYRRIAACNRSRKTVTARKTACAAVCTGKHLTDFRNRFIRRYIKQLFKKA